VAGILKGELVTSVAMRLRSPSTSADIFLMRHCLKMIWVDARPNPAKMINA
jgi:hypothetical protein